MKVSQVAAQLYTLRDHCKTSADLAATLAKVKAIGYPAIQVSGIGPITPEEVAELARAEGLVICATHEAAPLILNDPAAVVARLRGFGTRTTAYPYPAGVDFGDVAQVEALAAALNRAGAVLAAAGMTLCYHNHHHEFRKIRGQIILEYLFEHTHPSNLQGEIDTYWVQFGGQDPVAWCRRLAGRLPLLHLKDYQITSESKVTFAEIGQGTLDFPAIIAEAEASGCQWFIVEQDTCPGDPFDSLATSFRYLYDVIAER